MQHYEEALPKCRFLQRAHLPSYGLPNRHVSSALCHPKAGGVAGPLDIVPNRQVEPDVPAEAKLHGKRKAAVCGYYLKD